MNIRHITPGLAAAATALTVASGAMATTTVTSIADDVQTHSEAISYRAADLKTAAGAEELLTRLGGAAANVCSEPGTPWDNFENPAYRTCRRNAMERAVVQIDEPALTTAYEIRYPRRSADVKAALERHASTSTRTRVG